MQAGIWCHRGAAAMWLRRERHWQIRIRGVQRSCAMRGASVAKWSVERKAQPAKVSRCASMKVSTGVV